MVGGWGGGCSGPRRGEGENITGFTAGLIGGTGREGATCGIVFRDVL